jgi:hypothetical protein
MVNVSEANRIVVLCFEGIVAGEPRRAAVARVVEAIDCGAHVVVVCSEPIAMVEELRAAGVRTVALPTGQPDTALIHDLAGLGVVAVVDGGGRFAIALGDALRPGSTIIYTPETPVMTGNPARVASARRVAYASHLELLELAEHGDSPVSLNVAEDARKRGILYEIRNVGDDAGTVVRHDGYADREQPVTSISVSDGFAFLSVRPIEGDEERWPVARAECLERLAGSGISVEMLQFLALRMRFIVAVGAVKVTQAVIAACGLAWRSVPKCAKICLVGTGIRTTAGVFYRTLTGLSELEIPVLLFSDSNVTMTLLVPETHGQRAESFLHDVLAGGAGEKLSAAISFDAAQGRVRVNGRDVRLGTRQARLLEFLINNVGRVVEAEEAARYLFDSDGKDEIAALRVHLHNLRKKIEDDPDNPRFIVTVPAQGYLFVR